MKKRFLLAIACCIFLAGASHAAQQSSQTAAQQSSQTAAPDATVSHTEMTKQAMREQVRVMRQERAETMPYLDRGYIRYSINKDRIRDKSQFVTGDEKKLEDLLARAIQVHTPVRAARERISLARRRILAAFRNLFPEAKYEVHQKEGALSSSAFNSRNYRFSFRQPIFRGGILWNTLLQEQAGLETAEKDYEKTVADLAKDVSEAYFEYNRTLRVTEDQANAIEKMRRFAEISAKKFDQKITSEIEHLNVQSLFSQMEYDRETSVQELELAKLELQKFLDLDIQDDLHVAGLYQMEDLVSAAKTEEYAQEKEEKDQAAKKTAPSDSEESEEGTDIEKTAGDFRGAVDMPNVGELVDLAYEHRPELQVEAAKLQSAILDERINFGELLPHADFILEFGKLGEAFDVNSAEPGLREEFRAMVELTWNAAGSEVGYTFENDQRAPSVSQFLAGSGTQTMRHTISVGLLDGLKALVGAKEAEVEKLNQIAELEKTEKEVIHDVKQAYFDYQKSRIQMESSVKRLDYRQRLARLAEHRLGQNEIQISEYIQAEIDYLREETELHKALKDYFTAKSNLNRAIGVRDYFAIEESYGK